MLSKYWDGSCVSTLQSWLLHRLYSSLLMFSWVIFNWLSSSVSNWPLLWILPFPLYYQDYDEDKPQEGEWHMPFVWISLKLFVLFWSLVEQHIRWILRRLGCWHRTLFSIAIVRLKIEMYPQFVPCAKWMLSISFHVLSSLRLNCIWRDAIYWQSLRLWFDKDCRLIKLVLKCKVDWAQTVW